MESELIVVGVVSDDPFAIDVAHYLQQEADVADLISCKSFANSEFCPRFIREEGELQHVGDGLRGTTVAIVSTCCGDHTRNALAMRTFLVARAAKDNGADKVILVQPDLFYSAQDRGPRAEHGKPDFKRTVHDRKKFDGQPFSALLYAQLLRASGVDAVVTVHNHSVSVQRLFAELFQGAFFNLLPAELYAHYILEHGLQAWDREGLSFVVCAPDAGATPFVREVYDQMQKRASKMLVKVEPSLLLMQKARTGERKVSIVAAPDSPTELKHVRGRDVIVCDDMVRTGSTIAECCRLLKDAGARRVVFAVTHFYSSDEVKENLNENVVDEIITTNTLPTILNRDMQGRLRKKMLVLKTEQWLASFLRREFCGQAPSADNDVPYSVDISSKNPRWHR